MKFVSTLGLISIIVLITKSAPIQECNTDEYVGGTVKNRICIKCPFCLLPNRLNKPCNNNVKFPEEKFTCLTCQNGTCLYPINKSEETNDVLLQTTVSPANNADKLLSVKQIDLKYYWVYGLVIIVVCSLIFEYLWYCNGQRRKRLKEESHIDADDIIWMDDILLTESSSVFDAKDNPQRRPLFFNRPIVSVKAPLQTPTMLEPTVPFFEVEA